MRWHLSIVPKNFQSILFYIQFPGFTYAVVKIYVSYPLSRQLSDGGIFLGALLENANATAGYRNNCTYACRIVERRYYTVVTHRLGRCFLDTDTHFSH